MATPAKNTHASSFQTSEICRVSENLDPNLPISPPSQKPIESPAIRSEGQGLKDGVRNNGVEKDQKVLKNMKAFESLHSISEEGETERRLYSEMDRNGGRLSWGCRTSGGSQSKSSEFSGRSWNKKPKVTCQQPFKLRTEQRGRLKEEQFFKKVKEMLVEEEKKRIPIAQGLPWTIDEPECLVKPPAKVNKEPINIVLNSDLRAAERAKFDHFVAERMSFAEQRRLDRERQEKLEEEEEIRRLRKELVPKAQPMPYFGRPFVPKKSARPPTVPKEPRFHIRAANSSCISCREDDG